MVIKFDLLQHADVPARFSLRTLISLSPDRPCGTQLPRKLLRE